MTIRRNWARRALGIFALACAVASSAAGAGTIEPPRFAAPPKLDGRLDDACRPGNSVDQKSITSPVFMPCSSMLDF